MAIVAYAFCNPYLEAVPDFAGRSLSRLYLDQGELTAPRPQLQQLLQNCETAPPEAVLLARISDLGASVADVIAHIDRLEAKGIELWTLDGSYTTDKTTDTSATAIGRLAAHVQQQHQRQRLRAGHARNRVARLPPPGRAPYGYRRGRDRYALDRTAAPVVKAFFEQFLLFGSIRQASRHIEKTYGKRISPATAQRWLSHPVYRGDTTYQDGKTVRDTHTAIITREEAAQVDRLLRRNRRFPPKTASAPRSLAGLVHCQTCGSKLKVSRVSRPRQSKEYLYLCPIRCRKAPKPCRALPYDAVLNETIDAVCRQLPEAVDPSRVPGGAAKAALAAEIQAKGTVLEQLPALVEQGILDEVTADLRAYTLRGDLSVLEQRLAQLPPENFAQIIQTLSIRQFWQDLSEAERRVYLREFIQTIAIIRAEDHWDLEIRFVF